MILRFRMRPMSVDKTLADFPLLSAEDVRYIHQMGAPLGFRQDLVSVQGQAVTFTEKGRQFYRYACARCELPFSERALKTADDLAQLGYALGARTLDLIEREIAQDLDAGRVSPQDRELARAITQGSPEDVMQASARNRECSQAGSNVIPLGARFKKPPSQ